MADDASDPWEGDAEWLYGAIGPNPYDPQGIRRIIQNRPIGWADLWSAARGYRDDPRNPPTPRTHLPYAAVFRAFASAMAKELDYSAQAPLPPPCIDQLRESTVALILQELIDGSVTGTAALTFGEGLVNLSPEVWHGTDGLKWVLEGHVEREGQRYRIAILDPQPPLDGFFLEGPPYQPPSILPIAPLRPMASPGDVLGLELVANFASKVEAVEGIEASEVKDDRPAQPGKPGRRLISDKAVRIYYEIYPYTHRHTGLTWAEVAAEIEARGGPRLSADRLSRVVKRDPRWAKGI